MPSQYGFHVHVGRCVQCEACVAACKASHHLELGARWRRVISYWSGEFPRVSNRSFTLSCQHCERPACVEACAVEALVKRPEDGIVVVKPDACAGCRACEEACPYGAICFTKDDSLQKCDLCLQRLEVGLSPSCVATCPTDALQFGTIEELAALNGARRVEGELGPVLFITPPAQEWDEAAFYRALSKAKEPSVTTALTVIL